MLPLLLTIFLLSSPLSFLGDMWVCVWVCVCVIFSVCTSHNIVLSSQPPYCSWNLSISSSLLSLLISAWWITSSLVFPLLLLFLYPSPTQHPKDVFRMKIWSWYCLLLKNIWCLPEIHNMSTFHDLAPANICSHIHLPDK